MDNEFTINPLMPNSVQNTDFNSSHAASLGVHEVVSSEEQKKFQTRRHQMLNISATFSIELGHR
jgi:hypothetical protein